MRIISKFHDYYDGIQGYGRDPKLIYVRETKEIDLDWNEHREVKELELLKALEPLTKIYESMPHMSGHQYREYDHGVIAFCGTAYPWYDFEDTCYYSFDQLVEGVRAASKKRTWNQNNHKELLLKLLDEPAPRKWKHRWHWGSYGRLNVTTWEQFLEDFNSDIPDDLHRYFNSPIIVRENKRVIVNPNLKDYDFASQVDPWMAAQELSMYVGNNLATQKDPNVDIPDEIRAESHGFDKWSFRKKGKKNG